MIDTSKEIKFSQKDHIYTHVSSGQILTSVNQFLDENLVPPFDEDGLILRRCAARDGISPEELRAKWDQISQEACDYGTAVHSDVEFYIRTKRVRNNANKGWVKEFRKIRPKKGELQPEVIVYNLEYRLAGTIDIIHYAEDTVINILDIKTNKQLKKHSSTKFYPPLQYLYSNSWNRYCLQLNLYKFIVESMGYWVDEMVIYYFNPSKQKIELHEVPYMDKEITLILSNKRADDFFKNG